MAVFDKQGMYEVIENFYNQVQQGWELGRDVNIQGPVQNIVVSAVGASAIPGYILKQYLKDASFPIFVAEDFKLPAFCDRKTLVFAISYTGDAEETLAMYKDALKKGCQIISIGSGGKLREHASINKTRHIHIPAGLEARLAYPLMFFPMLKILENAKMIENQSEYVRKTIKVLKENKFEDITESVVEKLVNRIPIIYSSKNYEVVALKWKLNFNENVEVPSFYNVFQSAANNEIAGFAKKTGDFYVLMIKSDEEDQKMKKKIAIIKDLIRESGVPVTEVAISGDSYLLKIFSSLLIGEWLSYQLAIKTGVDPTPRKIIDELQKRMLS